MTRISNQTIPSTIGSSSIDAPAPAQVEAPTTTTQSPSGDAFEVAKPGLTQTAPAASTEVSTTETQSVMDLLLSGPAASPETTGTENAGRWDWVTDSMTRKPRRGGNGTNKNRSGETDLGQLRNALKDVFSDFGLSAPSSSRQRDFRNWFHQAKANGEYSQGGDASYSELKAAARDYIAEKGL
jgi:hypothetical protein